MSGNDNPGNFANRPKEDVQAAAQKGGSTQPSDVYKPKEHGGVKQDGSVDPRTSEGGQTEFAHGKVDPVEAGKEGGSK